jgi:membrane protease YdiL (CAAX protease family)
VVWWPGTVLGHACFVGSKLLLLALPLVWLRGVERGRPSWSPARQGGLLAGAVTGLAIFLVIGGLYLVSGERLAPSAEIRGMAERTGLASRTLYLGCALYWIGVNSVLEEYVWRWFVFLRLRELLPLGWAVAGAAFGFTIHHFVAIRSYLPPLALGLSLTGIFIGGALWSWLYGRYRSIWPGYLSHLGADLAIFLIGYRILFR